LQNEEERKIFSLLSQESTGIDELQEKTDMDISRISGILVTLQIAKYIRELPGKQFVRV